MTKIQQAAGKGEGHEEIGKIKDKYDKTKKEGKLNEETFPVKVNMNIDFTTDDSNETKFVEDIENAIQKVNAAKAQLAKAPVAKGTKRGGRRRTRRNKYKRKRGRGTRRQRY